MMKIRVSAESWEMGLFHGTQSGARFLFCVTLATARNEFNRLAFGCGDQAVHNNPFAVAVPSVIVPAWNVVLYPQAPGFWDHVSLESVEPFEFDPRLFPDGTPVESAI